MNAPFLDCPLGAHVRIDGIGHVYIAVQDAGCAFRSDVDGRTVNYSALEIAKLYFADKFGIPNRDGRRYRR